MKHFLDIDQPSATNLAGIIRHARSMKSARRECARGVRDTAQPLSGRLVALVFEKPSTRTRVSFDTGVRQLGGEVMTLSGAETQLGRGESIADTARVLSRYVDMIVIRTHRERNLLELAEHASVPVINGLTDSTHPCQVLGDVMTFEEHRGPIANRHVAWFGDGNNVCASFLHAAGQFGFSMTLACPEPYRPGEEYVAYARSMGAVVKLVTDPLLAAEGAGLVVTDAWLSMHDTEDLRNEKRELLGAFQVNDQVMAAATENAIFMHCLPAYRGEEVTSAVLDGPKSVVFDEAENRLHIQKAIMRYCLEV